MSRRKDPDLQKHTLFLRIGDWEKLASFYPTLPTSLVVRQLVSEQVAKLEAQLPQAQGLNSKVDL